MIYDYTPKQLRSEIEANELRTANGLRKYKNRLSYYRRSLTKFQKSGRLEWFKSDIASCEECIDLMQKVLAQLEADELEIDLNTEKMDIHERIEGNIATDEEVAAHESAEKEFFVKYFA